MATILIIGPHRFFFYSSDRDEPPHIHVERERMKAKFWLDPVRLDRSGGFSPPEINRIQRHVEANQEFFLRRWNEIFGD